MERPDRYWASLFPDEKWAVYIVRGLFCLLLAFIAKFVIDVPILQWIMMIAGTVYIALGIATDD